MKLNLFIRLHFVIALPLLVLGGILFMMNQPTAKAAGSVLQVQALSCNDPLYTSPITPADQYYGQAIPLLENQGNSTVALQSAYVGTPNALEKSLSIFSILKEGDIYYLWVANRLKAGSGSPINSLEQRFESKNGLVWCNRTNTNLAQTDTYKFLLGPRNIIKNGPLYEGWDEYYYEWSSGWGYALRYITSTNGITWTVVNQPAIIGTVLANVVKEGNTYRMWAEPYGDSSYQGTRSLRYRSSNNGGTDWGHWQTGGTLVNLDGGEIGNLTRVRQLTDGTYQLFYLKGDSIHLATSTNSITFTTQISNFVNLTKVLPITDVNMSLADFAVVDVAGEDWVYITYCTQASTSGHCINSHMAVARPTYRAELAITKTVTPSVVHPGDTITYTLTFSNTGPNTASGVVLTDILPSALISPVVNSNIAITDTGSLPRYIWQVQNLPPGAKGIITVTATVDPDLVINGFPPTNTFTNTATIAASILETDTSDNTASAGTLVVNPASPLSLVYLPAILANWPKSTFPIHIGDAISTRPVKSEGEIFYSQTIKIPAQLPSGGQFYFSSKPGILTKVVVDDKMVVLLDNNKVFSYDFSSSGGPQSTILKIPRATIEQIAGKTITVEYRDAYGVVVSASSMWLIWLP